MIRKTAILFSLIFLFILPTSVKAQNDTSNPFYIVQPGETLSIIADKFGVTVNDLINLNRIANPDLISPGHRLLIPGIEGISGELTTHTVEIGETLDLLSQKYLISNPILTKVNRLTSPNETYAGSELIISIDQSHPSKIPIARIDRSYSTFEAAIKLNLNPWTIPESVPGLQYSSLISDDLIYLPSVKRLLEINPIFRLIKTLSIVPLPLAQGDTEVVKVETISPMNFQGKLNGFDLHFYPVGNGVYYSYQGIHAMAEPGLATFSLNGEKDGKNVFSYQQMLLLKPTPFLNDPPINVSDQTIDPAITQPEDNIVKSIISVITSDKLWNGKFGYPMDEPICFKSVFGNRRSYNNGSLKSFHTGLDLGVCAPSLNVYSAASGKVVFAGPLTVRGNAIFIDHGQGIFSGYFHLAQIKIKMGDLVQSRQLIGLVGSTGRVTGPHLHFEIWVNGVQVNPLVWFQEVFPQ